MIINTVSVLKHVLEFSSDTSASQGISRMSEANNVILNKSRYDARFGATGGGPAEWCCPNLYSSFVHSSSFL